MGWLAKVLGLGSGPEPSRGVELPRINHKPGSYPGEAVGESNYQEALGRICGGHNRGGHGFVCLAELRPEPDNPYDENAVQVVIEKSLVGYLSRANAVRFHHEMATAGFAGSGAICGAKIDGGWRTNQHDEGSFGVKLALPGRGRFDLS